MTQRLLRKRRDMLLAAFSLSFLIPVGWIVGTELLHHLDDSRVMSRTEAQLLAEHTFLLLARTEAPPQDFSASDLLQEHLPPENASEPNHPHPTINADLIVLYGEDGSVPFARRNQQTLDFGHVREIALLQDVDPGRLQRSDLTDIETDHLIGATYRVLEYPYHLLVGYDREKIIRQWLVRAVPIFVVVIGLAVAIIVLTGTVHREIHHRFKAEEARAHENLRYLESLRVLAGGLAHRVNNQMMVVVGNLDILVDELGTPGRLHRFTSAIRSAATEASDLSVRLLATAGTAHIHPQSYTLAALVKKLGTATRESTVSGASLTTTVDSDCRHVTVSVDPDYLKIAVAGLVSNAVEAYPDDTAVKQVMLHLSVAQWKPTPGMGPVESAGAGIRHSTRLEAGRYVSLSVQDRAGGVPPDTFDHLFEPFFSTGFLGRGLGLSAVAGVAKQHGGGVIVESLRGHGTTVTIMIPVEESRAEDSGR